ncbi:TM2 domain-containing protein [Dysgonomonas sp. OttesenSCG-928-M03]|nr:TM2 domain-containing protein [Dysgonomonas sp. OttesenSCG-928-M03]
MDAFENSKMSNISKIDLFLTIHGSKFMAYQQEQVRQYLAGLSDEQLQKAINQDYKDPMMMMLISLMGGTLGIDRFVLNDTVLGVLKLITCGGFMIWTIIDWFLIQEMTREYNFNLLTKSTTYP